MILEALVELFFRGIIVPLIRLPGAVSVWAWSRGKTFRTVWLDGDEIFQFLVGLGILVLCTVLMFIF